MHPEKLKMATARNPLLTNPALDEYNYVVFAFVPNQMLAFRIVPVQNSGSVERVRRAVEHVRARVSDFRNESS